MPFVLFYALGINEDAQVTMSQAVKNLCSSPLLLWKI